MEKIFVGLPLTPSVKIKEGNWKKVTQQGKQYVGYIVEAPTISLKELQNRAKEMGCDLQHVTIFPIFLFG